MSARTPIFILLGMCLSFSLVLAAVIALRPQATPPKRRPPAAVQPRLPAAPDPTPTRHRPAETAAKAETKAEPKAPPPVVGTRALDMTPAAEAARELDLAKKELRAQIAALKKDRDQMLANLAGQLAGMPAAEAGAQLNSLDDESAALVLVRLKPEKRQALLAHLDPARARRLNQALTPLPR